MTQSDFTTAYAHFAYAHIHVRNLERLDRDGLEKCFVQAEAAAALAALKSSSATHTHLYLFIGKFFP